MKLRLASFSPPIIGVLVAVPLAFVLAWLCGTPFPRWLQ